MPDAEKLSHQALHTLFLALIFLITLGGCTPRGTDYTDNLKDIAATHPSGRVTQILHEPTPIGNLGHIETVVDLRGFVPMSLSSVSGFWTPTLTDFRWFKIPTKAAVSLLYYGTLKLPQLGSVPLHEDPDLRTTRFSDESQVTGNEKQWCLVAYATAKSDKPLFQSFTGKYDGTEPILVLFTRQSVFIIISVKYSTLNNPGVGQTLLALEFSRAFRKYKQLYPLYTTMVMTESAREDFEQSAHYVPQIVAGIFSGQ